MASELWHSAEKPAKAPMILGVFIFDLATCSSQRFVQEATPGRKERKTRFGATRLFRQDRSEAELNFPLHVLTPSQVALSILSGAPQAEADLYRSTHPLHEHFRNQRSYFMNDEAKDGRRVGSSHPDSYQYLTNPSQHRHTPKRKHRRGLTRIAAACERCRRRKQKVKFALPASAMLPN